MTGMWTQLLSTALVGTQRRAAGSVSVPPEVAAIVPIATVRSEADVLAAAGALTLARRAGHAARPDAERPVPSAPSERPPAPLAARNRLRHLVGDTVDVPMVELWLSLAVERGVAPAARDLPDLFKVGRAHEQLRHPIVTVAGARGTWLAAQRSDWAWVLQAHAEVADVRDDAIWDIGTPSERLAYLTTLRRRDPAAARALLARTWAKEPPAERPGLIGALATGLGPDDEDFCEAALDDRRKEVRATAASLLSRLPESAYAGRMTSRALASVGVGHTALRGRKITVSAPESLDESALRDGIDPRVPMGIGERAWWLQQIVSITPMSAWQGLGTPAELASASVGGGWKPPLRRAWALAAVRTRDAAWASALLENGYGQGGNADYADRSTAADLFSVLDPAAAEAMAGRFLDDADADTGHVTAVLAALPRPWSPRLRADLMTHLRTRLRAVQQQAYLPPPIRQLALAVVSGLPLDATADVTALARDFADANPMTTGLMDQLVTIATTRHQILQEFA